LYSAGVFIKMSNQKNDSPNSGSPGSQGGVLVDVESRVDKPKMYAVILLNDDYTPMDFVVLVIKRFFGKSEEEAIKVMLDVHQKGSGVAGIYHHELAEMKVMQVNQFAQMSQYPLKSTYEETT